MRSRLTLLSGIIRCVSLRSLVAALRVALGGRSRASAPAEQAVPIRMRACDGEPLYVRPGSSDLVNAIAYYRFGSELPPPGVEAPRTIVELGSNCGVVLTALAIRYPEATLLGVEPDPSNVAAARRNLERFGSRATVVEGAIWDRSAELVIDESSPAGEHAFAVREAQPDDPPEMTRLAASTIDEVLAGRLPEGSDIDFMHITIEGSEPRVLAAGGEWVSRVRSLRIETHDYFGFDGPECIRQLEELGFRAHEAERPPRAWVFGFRSDRPAER